VPLLVINLGMIWYTYNLLSNRAMYYFPAPYKEEGSWFFNLSAWFPLTLLLLSAPLTIWGIGYIRRVPSRPFARKLPSAGLFGLNGLVCGILFCLFGYWVFTPSSKFHKQSEYESNQTGFEPASSW
jgi:hypothetical protein